MLHLFNVLDRERFYTNMLDDKTNWRYYSAALVLIQRDFVKERPALVKDLIRLVKYWRKTFLPKKSAKRLPPSYLLELLTIHAWENANRPERFDMKMHGLSFKGSPTSSCFLGRLLQRGFNSKQVHSWSF